MGWTQYALIAVQLVCLGALAAETDDWWAAKELYQAALFNRTELARGARFEIGTVKWAQSRSSRPRFTGPWTEERFFGYWETEKPKVRRVYLPIQWTANEAMNGNMHWRRLNDKYINDVLAGLDRSYGYFTVIQVANGFWSHSISSWKVPTDINLTVYATGPTYGTRVVPIPLLKEVLQPQGLDKTLSVVFHGDLGHTVRRNMSKALSAEPNFIFKAHSRDWLSEMEQSNFTLAPRGWGHDSFRRWEALQLGSIPIYVYDDPYPWLPYSSLLDWDKLALNVHTSDIWKIPQMVLSLQESGQVSVMLDYIKTCSYVFTYEFMLSFIMADLIEHDS